MNKAEIADIEKMKRFADKGTDLFCNLLYAFKDKEIDDTTFEYLNIAMMALATDAYNQGYSEGNQKGYEDAEAMRDIFD